MEFFLPSLIIVIISALIAFTVLPRFSPLILAVISIVLLVFGIYHHMKIFGYEYTYSTWQDMVKPYAPAAMIILLMIVIIFYFMYIFGKSGAPKMNNIGELPSAESATNFVTEVINNTIRNVNNIVNIGNKKINNGLINTVNNTIVNTFSNVKSLIDGPVPGPELAVPSNNKAA